MNRGLNNLSTIGLNYIHNLSPTEIYIIIGLVAILLLFLVYRFLGSLVFFALIFVYMISYIIYTSNIYNFYHWNNNNNRNHMKNIQKEINKNNL